MSTPEACRAANVTLRQADYWIRRRALPLRQHGMGYRHRWSIADVAQLSIIGACARAGLDLERCFSAGWAARRALDDGHDQTCVILAPSTPPCISHQSSRSPVPWPQAQHRSSRSSPCPSSSTGSSPTPDMAMTLAALNPPPADPHAWRALAACKGADTDEFYPDSPSELSTVASVSCPGCPVRTDCLMWGVEHEEYGIWGGLTEAQRARMRKAAGIRLDSPQSHFPVGVHHDPEDPPYEEPEEDPDPWR